MDNFRIGQVVYLLTSSESGELVVHPVVVYEKILHQRIDGTTVSWKLMIGPKGRNKIVDSTKVEGELYESLERVKEITINRWIEYVDNLLGKAEKTSNEWYGDIQSLSSSIQSSEKISVEKLIAQENAPNEPAVEVKLPDGRTTTAR